MSAPGNNTSIVASSSSNGVTLVEQWIQTLLFYVSFGLLSMIGHLAVAVGIVRSKKLRTRFFVILWFAAMARAMISLYYAILGIVRVLRVFNVSLFMPLPYCYMLYIHNSYAAPVESLSLFGLVVDRILSIVAFKFYRMLTYQQAIRTCVVVATVTVALKIVAATIRVDFRITVQCINAITTLSDTYRFYHWVIEIALAAVILLLYLGLMVYIRFWHWKKLCTSGDRTALNRFKKQSRLLPLLRRTVFVHCGLTLVSRIVGTASSSTSGPIASRLVIYSGFLGSLELIINLIVLLASNKDLREVSLPCCNSAVEAPSGAQPGKQVSVRGIGR